ncbi:TM2 domain-containing protein [Daejeonella oryzae]|uniref:TM2 domain-containing protein n=1 Tax=Daejeonella oryzae TaxID=1122943 RepID=UPI0004116E24|nr:TM2 domain-containing protein [Daejeonella oryzae]
MIDQSLFMNLKGVTPDEYQFLQKITEGLDESQARFFMMYYSGKRKSPQDILLFTLLGFVVVAGVQRFVIGQIGMGLLYLLTFGLCFIGTIVDLINHRSLAEEYNRHTAIECVKLTRYSVNSADNFNR